MAAAGLTFVLASPASAAQIEQPGAAGALNIATSMVTPGTVVTGASYLTAPPNGVTGATSDTPLTQFPTSGTTFGVLSSGFASQVGTQSTGSGLGGGPVRGDTDRDVTVLQIDLTVAPTANCLSLDFQFLSNEFPRYVGDSFNDAFIAELDTTTWTTAGSTITAPNNFAFDGNGDVVSINATGVGGLSRANAAGTAFANPDSPADGGATTLLKAARQITPGPHTLYLSIFDQGDASVDSAVFMDNLTTGFVNNPAANCVAGAAPVNYTMDLTPATATSPVGTAHTVTTTVLDNNGAPVANAPVTFTVTGVNTAAGTGVTNARGQATYTYTGTNAGTDGIAACYLPAGDTSCAATASATKVWIAAPTATISTTPSGTVTVGGVVSDTATVGGPVEPTGTVTFELYANETCTGTPVETSTTPLVDGTANSGPITTTAAGTYQWVATYSGDEVYAPVISECGDETVVVAKATPTLTIDPPTTVESGDTFSDTAVLAGAFQPTGTVTFGLFSDASCTGTAVALVSVDVVNGSATSPELEAGEAGTYYWSAIYSGDDNNDAVAAVCSEVTVTAAVVTDPIAATGAVTGNSLPIGVALLVGGGLLSFLGRRRTI